MDGPRADPRGSCVNSSADLLLYSASCLRVVEASLSSAGMEVLCRGSFSGIEAGCDRFGDVGDDGSTNESRGLPSNSGSGRVPNLELFDADRPGPLPVVNDHLGDIINPAGENPPDRAAELTSTMEEAFETCLDI